MMETENATIKKVFLGLEGHGIPTFSLDLLFRECVCRSLLAATTFGTSPTASRC